MAAEFIYATGLRTHILKLNKKVNADMTGAFEDPQRYQGVQAHRQIQISW